jgi:hypothetical protein
MSVFTDTIPGQPAAGSFGWIGGYGSSWISDPPRDLTMILLTQHEFSSARGDPIHQEYLRHAREHRADVEDVPRCALTGHEKAMKVSFIHVFDHGPDSERPS